MEKNNLNFNTDEQTYILPYDEVSFILSSKTISKMLPEKFVPTAKMEAIILPQKTIDIIVKVHKLFFGVFLHAMPKYSSSAKTTQD